MQSTFAPSDDRHTSWLAPHREDDGPLHPGDEEVRAFPHHVGQDTAEPIKDNRPLSPINWREWKTCMAEKTLYRDNIYLCICACVCVRHVLRITRKSSDSCMTVMENSSRQWLHTVQ